MYSLKTPLRFVFLPLAVLFLTAAGCENGLLGDDKQKPNRHYWEVEINDKKKMIEQTVKGIEFKFCLLNENSVPSTVFEEGENFFFYFTVKNTLHEKLYFDKDFMRFDFHTFCKVWEINGNSVGKPFVFRGIDKIGVGAYPFPQNETYAFKFPWLYDFELWNSLFRYNKELKDWKILWTYFESTGQKPLKKGKYFTKFSHKFSFVVSRDDKDMTTDTLTFKINFQIH